MTLLYVPPQVQTPTHPNQMRPSSSVLPTAPWGSPSLCSSSPFSPTSSSALSLTPLYTTCELTGVCPTLGPPSSTLASCLCSSCASSSSSLPSWSVWWSPTGTSWTLFSTASSSWAPSVRGETLWEEAGAQRPRRPWISWLHVRQMMF